MQESIQEAINYFELSGVLVDMKTAQKHYTKVLIKASKIHLKTEKYWNLKAIESYILNVGEHHTAEGIIEVLEALETSKDIPSTITVTDGFEALSADELLSEIYALGAIYKENLTTDI